MSSGGEFAWMARNGEIDYIDTASEKLTHAFFAVYHQQWDLVKIGL
jgi:hypothetical protein